MVLASGTFSVSVRFYVSDPVELTDKKRFYRVQYFKEHRVFRASFRDVFRHGPEYIEHEQQKRYAAYYIRRGTAYEHRRDKKQYAEYQYKIVQLIAAVSAVKEPCKFFSEFHVSASVPFGLL